MFKFKPCDMTVELANSSVYSLMPVTQESVEAEMRRLNNYCQAVKEMHKKQQM